MSGKAYTMKEMKAIVEYLTEHRAYGEIKGRKMWIEYANSNQTTRTWQSLKETFLKRILPDITNPYYKLTVKQISSFRQGSDIEAKLNNKLEIRTADEDSNSNDAQDGDPQTSNSKNDNEVHEPGEDPLPPMLKRNRSSTDTVVIEPCYNSAEEIQKELESPGQKEKYEDISPKVSQAKSLRDYITYSEPLTPILQEVLHDFETDDEEDGSDKEPEMQIVEYPELNIPNHNLTPSEIIDTENNDGEGDKKKENQKDNIHDESHNQKKAEYSVVTVQDSTETEHIKIPDNTPLSNSDDNINDITKKNNDDNPDVVNGSVEPNSDVQVQKNSVDQQRDLQNQSIPSTDTLPNNQEAYKELYDTRQNVLNEHSELSDVQKYLNDSRKRSKSQEIQSETLVKRLRSGKKQSSSDIDGKAQKINNIKTKLGKKKNIRNKNEKKKKNNENVQSNESHLYLQKNIENIPVNTENVCLSDDTNKQQLTTVENTSKNTEKEKTPISSTEKNPAFTGKEDVSGKIKSAQEVEREKDVMPQSCNQKTENDMTSISNEIQRSAKLNRDDTNIKSKYKLVSKEGKVTADNYIKEVINEVVILKSHSDSASDHVATTPTENKASRRVEHKRHRDKALSNIFGFSSGLSTSRKKAMKHRKRLPSFRMDNTPDSDEWTSDTESEYVSPPRGRKNRQRRKYLKPKSAKILSLEEEGGLFVVYGKQIIPIVKDGKIIKNYTTFSPGKDSDDESFWKLKYVEEKKKTEELTKLLKDNKKLQSASTESEVPVAVSRGKSTTPLNIPKENDAVTDNQIGQRQQICKETEKINPEVGEPKTVKIKYTKNNEELQLEGHWSHVHPVLEHLVHILHKDQEQTKVKSIEIENPITEKKAIVSPTATKVKTKTEKPKTMENDANEKQQDTDANKLPGENQKPSRNSSPVSLILLEDDVQDKINKIEDEIFKQIEEREKADSIHEDTTITNVTQRKGLRTRKSSSVVDQASSAKKPKVSSVSNKALVKDQALQDENKNIPAEGARQTRAPKKVNEKELKEKKNENVERRVTRKSLQDAQNKYNFRTSPATKKPTKVNTKQKPGKITVQPTRVISSPDNVLNDSVESSLGYQDSDVSTISMSLRKKRKLSLTVLNKGKASSRRGSNRKVQLYATETSSDSSSLSFITVPVKQSSRQSSSLNTEVYRSESYQMLFPQKQYSYKHLEKIEEFGPSLNLTYSIDKINNNYVSSNSCIEKSQNSNIVNIFSPSFAIDEDNSSQITLPPSPVLSIVENISVNKNVLSSPNDMPVDMMIDDINGTGSENMGLDVDMSVPLIKENCGLQKSTENVKKCNFNKNVPEASQLISDSFLSKVSAVNIKEPSLSESIHQKLKNLLLESAKKLANHINKSDKNDINKIEISEPESQRKTKGRKRCSTPRKRQKRQNVKVDNTEQLIQEHTESCGSKNSFPTPLLVVTDASDLKQGTDKPKARKKKDVIKVKISKPNMKKKEKVLDEMMEKEAKTSLQTDSGINDTESGVFFQGNEDTVDLIHNHSETCLHAHECVGNSVEVIDENAMSIITLNSNSSLVKELKTSKSLINVNENALLDIFCEDAQDALNLFTAIKKPKETTNENGANLNISDTNISSRNSLLTDDLSDETVVPTPPKTRSSKWYLLSEDETSNTNLINIASRLSNSNSGCGSNLEQIFPITCAVPDLSTITEEHTPKINTVDTQSLPSVNM